MSRLFLTEFWYMVTFKKKKKPTKTSWVRHTTGPEGLLFGAVLAAGAVAVSLPQQRDQSHLHELNELLLSCSPAL